jgi:hypothetical protein
MEDTMLRHNHAIHMHTATLRIVAPANPLSPGACGLKRIRHCQRIPRGGVMKWVKKWGFNKKGLLLG